MIKIENHEVMGWEHAIRGMRNPMNSWGKMDSYYTDHGCSVGNNDLGLMKHLAKAGTDHRKFMRMITVYVDITAPLYWWKEYDTYKIGTVANSCSTMHKIADKEFTLDDFSCEHLSDFSLQIILDKTIEALNHYREQYLLRKKNFDWWQMIQLLPSSYNQRRTLMLNYEVLANIYKSRKNHKLDEWRDFCAWIEELPYSELITGETDESLKFNGDKNILGHVKQVEEDDHGVKFTVDVTDENVLGEINTRFLNRSHLVHVFQSLYNAAKTEEEKRDVESLYNKMCKENKEE